MGGEEVEGDRKRRDVGGTGLGGWEVAGAGLGWRKGLWGLGDTAVPANRNSSYSVLNVGDTAGEGEGGADRGGSTDGYSQSLCKQSRQLVQSCCTAQGREA